MCKYVSLMVSKLILKSIGCAKYSFTHTSSLSLVIPWASCSKLTTSLVNVSLKFQTLILQMHCYFLTKNNSVFVTLADICLTNLCLNDIVKLTML